MHARGVDHKKPSYLTIEFVSSMLTAEVIPIAKKSTEAAVALQKVGFKILFIGQSITITGEQKLFEQFFKTKLMKLSKDVLPGLEKPAEIEFFRPETALVIPSGFRSLIKDVVFAEPPEYFY